MLWKIQFRAKTRSRASTARRVLIFCALVVSIRRQTALSLVLIFPLSLLPQFDRRPAANSMRIYIDRIHAAIMPHSHLNASCTHIPSTPFHLVSLVLPTQLLVPSQLPLATVTFSGNETGQSGSWVRSTPKQTKRLGDLVS